MTLIADIALATEIGCKLFAGILKAPDAQDPGVVEVRNVCITEPIPKYGETRCYIRDPDGHIIEVRQSTDLTYG